MVLFIYFSLFTVNFTMEKSKNVIIVSTASTKHENIDNFDIKLIEGLFAIQTLRGLPKHLYTYKSKKFNITQITPYKPLKSFIYKDEIVDFCFSYCGLYMFVMSSDKIIVYSHEKQVAKIHGTFSNCKISAEANTVIVTGNYNIFVFEHVNNNNKFFEMSKDDDFEFGLKTKLIGSACYVNFHFTLFAKDNVLNMEVIDKIKLSIKYPSPITQILCKTVLSKVYCLCADKKVYKTVFDGTKTVSQIEEDNVEEIGFSFDEKYLTIRKKRSLHVYETVNDILIDELNFCEDIIACECVLGIETSEVLEPIIIKK